jgi:glycosyltransferase involved in cell wall biosynthesis
MLNPFTPRSARGVWGGILTSSRHSPQGDTGVSPPTQLGAHPAEFVSVIVPVYNGEDGVTTLLAALSAQDYPAESFEILVVDNGSADRTMAVVEAYAESRPSPKIRLLTEHERRGSYAARNKGVSVAKGTILAFTDADCRPVAGWIAAGVDAMRQSSAEQAGGAIEFLFANQPPNAWEQLDSLIFLRQSQYVREFGWSATANLFVRADALASVGGFRADLQSGGDAEFGLRMKAAGFRIVYSPEALIRHEARATHHEVATKARRISAGLEQLAGEGRIRPLSLVDFKPRRRLPEGSAAARPGFLRHVVLIVLLNYVHYLRLHARLSARKR